MKNHINVRLVRNLMQTKKMIEHKRSHTGETPFQCTKCDKSFMRKTTLIDHEKIHRGEPYGTCKICGKRFMSRPGLCKVSC